MSQTGEPEIPATPGPRVGLDYRVPYADTDQMRVVYYANYFVYFERLRNELIRACGLSYRAWEERGLICPVIEAYCAYRQPARYDDLIRVEGWLAWARGSRFRVEYEILLDGEQLATGHTIHSTMTPEGLPRRVPEEIQGMLGS